MTSMKDDLYTPNLCLIHLFYAFVMISQSAAHIVWRIQQIWSGYKRYQTCKISIIFTWMSTRSCVWYTRYKYNMLFICITYYIHGKCLKQLLTFVTSIHIYHIGASVGHSLCLFPVLIHYDQWVVTGNKWLDSFATSSLLCLQDHPKPTSLLPQDINNITQCGPLDMATVA